MICKPCKKIPLKSIKIPIQVFSEGYEPDILVARANDIPTVDLKHVQHAHRHNKHAFFLLLEGKAIMEVDFESIEMTGPSLIYIHPSQVHRAMTYDSSNAYFLGISSDCIHPHYLTSLEQEILPAPVLLPVREVIILLEQTISLCYEMIQRSESKLLVKDFANAFIGLVQAQYVAESARKNSRSRYAAVYKQFNVLLENNFTILRTASDYAAQLNISPNYLNECLKNATGQTPSELIQQRIVLEAKRLLHHSDLSVKEIALQLGFDDHSYFSRVFKKITTEAPLSYRAKNRE